MNRSDARELAFKLIYQFEIQKENNDEDIELFINNLNITEEKVIEYIYDISHGINNNLELILSIIENNLKEDWELNRISKTNIAILKIAVYEMLIKKLPYKVVINEAVELAKKYGDDTSHVFVNGILASVVKENKLSN